MTVVQPDLQWGSRSWGTGDGVGRFVEKPRSEHWINGGFFCFEARVFAYVGADSVLSASRLASAAGDKLRAFRHAGFWVWMDTCKDAVILNDLWVRGEAPWPTGLPSGSGPRTEADPVARGGG